MSADGLTIPAVIRIWRHSDDQVCVPYVCETSTWAVKYFPQPFWISTIYMLKCLEEIEINNISHDNETAHVVMSKRHVNRSYIVNMICLLMTMRLQGTGYSQALYCFNVHGIFRDPQKKNRKLKKDLKLIPFIIHFTRNCVYNPKCTNNHCTR